MSHSEILPFGSSVNSFGKFNSDLDVVVKTSYKNHKEVALGKESCRKHLEVLFRTLNLDGLSFYKVSFIHCI